MLDDSMLMTEKLTEALQTACTPLHAGRQIAGDFAKNPTGLQLTRVLLEKWRYVIRLSGSHVRNMLLSGMQVADLSTILAG